MHSYVESLYLTHTYVESPIYCVATTITNYSSPHSLDMSAQEPRRLGWIGLGSMGLAMATNIQKHLTQHNLPPLKYWNRTLSRGDILKDEGGTPCAGIADLVQNSDVIFISVSCLLGCEEARFF
jgi:hypothetical protein